MTEHRNPTSEPQVGEALDQLYATGFSPADLIDLVETITSARTRNTGCDVHVTVVDRGNPEEMPEWSTIRVQPAPNHVNLAVVQQPGRTLGDQLPDRDALAEWIGDAREAVIEYDRACDGASGDEEAERAGELRDKVEQVVGWFERLTAERDAHDTDCGEQDERVTLSASDLIDWADDAQRLMADHTSSLTGGLSEWEDYARKAVNQHIGRMVDLIESATGVNVAEATADES
ncbi:hypothetical protein [Saccharothrix hoggarensis]|uniref:Uncharacterized protein n=1 Tax=Saccharothrix hoggarensis TaxID=913853 RepID=A0ABW3QHS7_9PSEU